MQVSWIHVRDGSNRVDDTLTWQIICIGDLGLPGRLLVALHLHDARTFSTELHTGKGVDGVICAVVPGDPAAEHL